MGYSDCILNLFRGGIAKIGKGVFSLFIMFFYCFSTFCTKECFVYDKCMACDDDTNIKRVHKTYLCEECREAVGKVL